MYINLVRYPTVVEPQHISTPGGRSSSVERHTPTEILVMMQMFHIWPNTVPTPHTWLQGNLNIAEVAEDLNF